MKQQVLKSFRRVQSAGELVQLHLLQQKHLFSTGQLVSSSFLSVLTKILCVFYFKIIFPKKEKTRTELNIEASVNNCFLDIGAGRTLKFCLSFETKPLCVFWWIFSFWYSCSYPEFLYAKSFQHQSNCNMTRCLLLTKGPTKQALERWST